MYRYYVNTLGGVHHCEFEIEIFWQENRLQGRLITEASPTKNLIGAALVAPAKTFTGTAQVTSHIYKYDL